MWFSRYIHQLPAVTCVFNLLLSTITYSLHVFSSHSRGFFPLFSEFSLAKGSYEYMLWGGGLKVSFLLTCACAVYLISLRPVTSFKQSVSSFLSSFLIIIASFSYTVRHSFNRCNAVPIHGALSSFSTLIWGFISYVIYSSNFVPKISRLRWLLVTNLLFSFLSSVYTVLRTVWTTPGFIEVCDLSIGSSLLIRAALLEYLFWVTSNVYMFTFKYWKRVEEIEQGTVRVESIKKD
ncbi:hypothetical protein RCL1_000306 [Eukaryota sp. TZLM3-RCL]